MKNKLIRLLGGYTKEDIRGYNHNIMNNYIYESVNKTGYVALQSIINNALELLDKKLLK